MKNSSPFCPPNEDRSQSPISRQATIRGENRLSKAKTNSSVLDVGKIPFLSGALHLVR